MVLSMQRGTTAFLVAETKLGVRSGVREPISGPETMIVAAQPNPGVDWNELMVETEAEWSQTLEYLGR